MKHDPAPGATRANLERAFERKVRRSQWALLFERLWPRLWIIIAILTLFAVVSVLGLWPRLDDTMHYAVLAVFAAALLAALVFAVRTPWPAREEAVRRIERVSGAVHRPASSYEDTLSSVSRDGVAETLWRAHRERLARAMRGCASVILRRARIASIHWPCAPWRYLRSLSWRWVAAVNSVHSSWMHSVLPMRACLPLRALMPG